MRNLLLAGALTLAVISIALIKVPAASITHDDQRWAEGLTIQSPR